MAAIAKTDFALGPQQQMWQSLMQDIHAQMRAREAHPARTVVLLPFFQLLVMARTHSAQGFVPRFETTQSWSTRVAFFTPGELDLSFDSALDGLRARQWLHSAGLSAQHAMLGGRLVDAAQQIAGAVAAVPPAQRAQWGARTRAALLTGLEANPLAYEAAVSRIALEWALASRYATDVLFDDATGNAMDCLIVVQGLQPNALATTLQNYWADKACALSFAVPDSAAQIQLHAATDAQDEAERAAACVLRHIDAGRTPVALAAVDRVLTRRISAQLHLHGALVHDETGWKLSTTRAAAQIMTLLRAARFDASDDALLDWLKHTPAAHTAALHALEALFRKQNVPQAQLKRSQAAIQFIATDDASVPSPDAVEAAAASTAIEKIMQSLRSPRTVAAWLQALASSLQGCGMWRALQADDAGMDCIAALHLEHATRVHSNLRLSLAEFTSWVQDALESASFKPALRPDQDAQVIILPLSQVLARPFAALVLPGADEQHLPASPEPVGAWTAAQRAALGLAQRHDMAAAQSAAWQCALHVPQLDVLWRTVEGDQSVLPSALVQGLMASGSAPVAAQDPRDEQLVTAAPIAPPQPQAGALRITQLSASAYEDLRRCPYRYFALRMLRLQEADELDAQLDKRDWGTWLHSVLRSFHAQRSVDASTALSDAALMQQVAQAQWLHDSGFVPFAAAWPQVRDQYVQWLHQHEAEGWRFEAAEVELSIELAQGHANFMLRGKIDRVDRLGHSVLAGMPYVLDYKTESASISAQRVKTPMEDTQLAFYALLLQEDDVHAAYVNMAERDCKTYAQPNVMAARDALRDGIAEDVQRIHSGAAMPALGEGRTCDFCAARGLCRKDFWAQP